MSTRYSNSATGNDSTGTGSSGAPYATVGKAIAVSSTGDTILLSGSFSENNTAITLGLTIQPYGTGATVAGANSSDTLGFTNAAGAITVSGITVTNADTTGTYDCIHITISDGATHNAGVTISGCTLTGGRAGFHAQTTTNVAGFLGNISITTCTVSGQIERGIWMHVLTEGDYNYSNVNVQSCVVSGVLGLVSGNVPAVGIELSGCNNSIAVNYIQQCTVSDLGSTGAHNGTAGPAGMFPFYSTHVIMQENVVSGIFMGTGGYDGIGIDIDDGCIDCSTINNYIYGCQGPGLTFLPNYTAGSKHVIAGNVCVNNCTAGGDACHVEISGTDSLDFFNNTIIGSSAYPALLVNSVDAGGVHRILNNAFLAPAGINSATFPGSLTGTTINGNYYQSGCGLFSATFNSTNYTSLASWKTATSQEANGAGAGNAYFVAPQPPPALTGATLAGASVFAPVSGSPLLGAGATLSGYSITPANDIVGNAYSQSIGAIYALGAANAYRAAILAYSPMASWRLAEPVGSADSYDSCANFEPIVWTSATLGETVLVPGDGSTSVLTSSVTPAYGVIASLPHTYALTAVSLSFWAKPSSVTGTQGMVGFYAQTDTREFFQVSLNGTALIAQTRDTGNGVVASYPGFTFAVNTDYHIVVTWTGTTQTCYVNGVSQTPTYTQTTALSGGMSLGTVFGIGTSFTAGPVAAFQFDGLISNFDLFPSVLTGAQIAAIYSAGLSAIRGRRSLYDRAGCRGVA